VAGVLVFEKVPARSSHGPLIYLKTQATFRRKSEGHCLNKGSVPSPCCKKSK